MDFLMHSEIGQTTARWADWAAGIAGDSGVALKAAMVADEAAAGATQLQTDAGASRHQPYQQT